MKNIVVQILGLFLVLFIGYSCKKEMIELNTNPNLLNDVGPEYLFSGATVDMNFGSRDRIAQKYGSTMKYMQYIVPEGVDQAGLAGQYWDPLKTTGPNPGFPYYNDYFSAIGRDMNRIIAAINAMDQDNYKKYIGLKAICQIVDTYHAWRVADIFGAMPYSQAFNTEKYPLPVYDYNYDLYKVLDSKLKDAATILRDNTTGLISLGTQDFFYAGDYTKWYKLANSLRLKIAQRYEKRDAANLTSVISDVVSNFGSAIISDNSGSFAVNHSRDWATNVDDINVILFNYNASFPFVEHLKYTNDPRIKFMIRENDMGTNCTQYNNVLTNGTPDAITSLGLPENQVRYWGKYSTPASAQQVTTWGSCAGDRYKTFDLKESKTQNLGFLSAIQSRLFVKNGGFGGFHALSDKSLMHTDETYVDGSTIKMKSFLVTYAEVCFMMAEIAEKGGNGMGKSAEIWFRTGVEASFDQYKAMAVATNVPNASSVSGGSFSTTITYLGLSSIYTQSWVHFLMQPDESWAMWKRTGYPMYTDARAGNNGQIGKSTIAYLENLWDGGKNLLIPRRNTLNETSVLNETNWKAAVAAMIAKDASYGVNESDTKGHIWWDK